MPNYANARAGDTIEVMLTDRQAEALRRGFTLQVSAADVTALTATASEVTKYQYISETGDVTVFSDFAAANAEYERANQLGAIKVMRINPAFGVKVDDYAMPQSRK